MKVSGTPAGRSSVGSSRPDCASTVWMRRSTSRMASKIFGELDLIALDRARRCRRDRLRVHRIEDAAVLLDAAQAHGGSVLSLSPNRRSNTTRGRSLHRHRRRSACASRWSSYRRRNSRLRTDRAAPGRPRTSSSEASWFCLPSSWRRSGPSRRRLRYRRLRSSSDARRRDSRHRRGHGRRCFSPAERSARCCGRGRSDQHAILERSPAAPGSASA